MRVPSAVFFSLLPILFGSLLPCHATEEVSVASIQPEELVEYPDLSPAVANLVRAALELTEQELGYQFGSNRPEKGGMDCSGTVQCALRLTGLEELPRSSYGFYEWARDRGSLVDTLGATTTDDPRFSDLKPGDLLFWQGTYETGKRNPPISHVMIYLGTLEKDGAGVVFGASDGRRFRGQRINGVSVFDWRVPPATSKSKFVGYARIPGLEELAEAGSVAGSEEEKGDETGGETEQARPLKSALEKIFGRREPDAR